MAQYTPPGFPPGYGPPQGAPAPAAAPAPGYTPPGAPAQPAPAQFGGPPGYGPPAAPAYGAPGPGQFAPQAPPAAAPPGYGPPAAPAYGVPAQPPQPPAGFAPYAGPQGAAPQGFGGGSVDWNGMGSASVTPKSNPIPLGMHEVEWIKCELARTGSGLFFFAHFRITQSADARLAGFECTFKQNMNPATRGGDQIALAAVKGMILPFLGYRSDARDLDQYIGGIMTELTQRGTIQGQPFAGKRAGVTVTPGKRKANTPPDKEPFPRIVFTPVGQAPA